MKIIGGSFGLKGHAFVARDIFAIEGSTKQDYRADEIVSVNARIEKSRKFGVLGFIIGALLFTVLGSLLLGLLGAVIGFAISIAGSFYSNTTNIVDIEFRDGKKLSAEGSPRAIEKITRFAKT